MKFDDLLEKLEADGKILNFRFSTSKIPMYLVVRFALIQSLINKEFNLSNPHVKTNKKTIEEILKYVYHTLKANIFFAPKKDIYIFSSGIVNRLENDQYTNRLYDDFSNLFKNQTQIIESSVKLSYLIPKKEKIYFKDLVDIFIVLGSKVLKMKNQDLIEIDNFIKYLQNNILLEIDDSFLEEITINLRQVSKKISFSFWMYRQLFRIKIPKLIIVEDAHYFCHIALIKAAKSLGIKTAEYQHGYIGCAHPAYNYHKNIFEDIKEFLPQFFLTHGEYWSNVVRTPSKKISVGFVELSKKMSKIMINEEKKKKILFISGGTLFAKLNTLIEQSLNGLYDLGYEVLFRPHPSEIPAIDRRYATIIKQGVQIDTNNLYATLPIVQIVIGMEVSTVLYEAMCFTNKVYLADLEYTKFYEPKSRFLTFTNANDLINLIQNSEQIDFHAEYYWDSHWAKNYINFIETTIGLKYDDNNH